MSAVDAMVVRSRSQRIASMRSDRTFVVISALIFAASTAATITGCRSMSAMPEMPMPGGWSMSMTWMRMPGQTWAAATTSFLVMWIVMMSAMMLPPLVQMLRRYRIDLRAAGKSAVDGRTALAGAAYFFTWSVLGLAVFVLGSVFETLVMRMPAFARVVPTAASVVVLVAGALQFAAWKTRHLDCCRGAAKCGYESPACAGSAWRRGVRLGFHCMACCAPLTMILLVFGLMDLRAMAIVTTAITAERFAPSRAPVVHVIGCIVMAAGLLLFMRAVGPG